MSRLSAKSDSQANAEALARRTSTYADEHAASWDVRFDRVSHRPKSLRGYVNELRDAYAAECPASIHVHAVDGGGTPAYSQAFERWLSGDDHGPFRDALRGMERANNGKTQRQARIAFHVIVGGLSATQAAEAEGAHPHDATDAAELALTRLWDRYASTPLPRSATAA